MFASPRRHIPSPPTLSPIGTKGKFDGSPGSRSARRTARMALVHATNNAVEAAKLLLPRASLLEVTELAHDLDMVAQFHFPGVVGW